MQKQHSSDPISFLQEGSVIIGDEEWPRDHAAVESELWPGLDGVMEELPSPRVDFFVWGVGGIDCGLELFERYHYIPTPG